MAKHTYEYTGVVEEVGETKTVGKNNFTKREIIVGRDVGDTSKWPNPVKFTFKKEGCSMLDGIRNGQRVTVVFAIDGRRWDGPKGTMHFVDLVGIRIYPAAAEQATVPPPAEPPQNERICLDDVSSDDLPF